MDLKVRYSEVRDVSSVIEKDSQLFDTEIDNILNNLEKLREIWKGYDSDQFYEHATAYFTTMRNIPVAMRNIHKSIGTALDSYKSSEDAFSQMVRGESERYPKQKSITILGGTFSPSSIANTPTTKKQQQQFHYDSTKDVGAGAAGGRNGYDSSKVTIPDYVGATSPPKQTGIFTLDGVTYSRGHGDKYQNPGANQ